MWFSVPGKGKRFLFSPKCQAFFAAHEVNCPVDTKARTLEVRWLGQEPDLSSPSTASVKKKKHAWSHIHTPSIHLHGTVFNYEQEHFIFIFLSLSLSLSLSLFF